MMDSHSSLGLAVTKQPCLSLLAEPRAEVLGESVGVACGVVLSGGGECVVVRAVGARRP